MNTTPSLHPNGPRGPGAKSAFTLMELLIVMTIIGALVTLTVPATQRVMGKSKAAHCLGNLSGLGSALVLLGMRYLKQQGCASCVLDCVSGYLLPLSSSSGW